MTMHDDMLSYAITSSAYIISSMSYSDRKKIKNVILFGSVAQMRTHEESDVDIFFDTDAPQTVQNRIKTSINKMTGQWKMTQDALRFKMKKIDNDINVTVGNLDEWADLHRSIASSGIVLYGKYVSKQLSKTMHIIFSWENLGKNKGAILNKLYGYKSGKKYYSGLLEKNHGKKLGRGTIMIPADKKEIITDMFEKYGIDYSMFEVWA
ncbi:nucleotidyltransferase domain-containing protein [archaeon]|nr:nucleotidyltransferase domain-containing protein [archaeon]